MQGADRQWRERERERERESKYTLTVECVHSVNFLDRCKPFIAPIKYTALIADISFRTYLRHVSVQVYRLQGAKYACSQLVLNMAYCVT